MRVSVKVDYALRAMAHLATHVDSKPVKAEEIAAAQKIPVKFLPSILTELRRDFLVRSERGPEGGYLLRRPPGSISLADVMRAVDGPLANVHDTSLEDLGYVGAAASLKEVWMALRSSLRAVLEAVTLEDLISGELPVQVRDLANEYQRRARESLPLSEAASGDAG